MTASCAEVRRALLEGDPLAPDPAVVAHVEGCAACREVAEAVAAVDRDLARGVDAVLAQPLPVPVATTDSATTRAAATRRYLTMSALVLATAATLALALGPSLSSPSGPSDLATRSEKVDADRALLSATERLPDDALTLSGWAARRDGLHAVWSSEARSWPAAERFALAAQLGRSAELAGEAVAPYFVSRDGQLVNAFYAEARRVDDADPADLLQEVADPRLLDALGRAGVVPRSGPPPVVKRATDNSYIPWNALTPADWAGRLDALAAGYTAQQQELSPEEYATVLSQLGRLVTLAERSDDPRFVLDGTPRAWLALASLELTRPGLLKDRVLDDTLRQDVLAVVDRMRAGEVQGLRLADVVP